LATTWNSWRRFCNTPPRKLPTGERGSRGALRLLNSQCLLPALALTVKPFGNDLNWVLNEDGDGGGGCEGVSMVLRWRRWLLETLVSIVKRTQRKKMVFLASSLSGCD